MEKKEKSPLLGRNPFAEAFAEFDETAFFENLHNTVKNKPYFEKYKDFKTTLLWLSYLFNLASALTASYAIFWLTKWITGIALVGYIVAVVFLFFLEKIKRKSSTEFWQVFFFRKQFAAGWFGLSMFCLALSLFSSGFGVKQGTENLAPSPELLAADSMATYYRKEIAKLEQTNERLTANKNKDGITFYKLYDAINANTATIADYTKRSTELEKKTDGKNDKLTASYMEEVTLTAWTLVLITLLMELLFEGCIAYVWYYYHRSYVERFNVHSTHKMHIKDMLSTHKPPTTSLSENEQILQLIEQLQTENHRLKIQPVPPPPIHHNEQEVNHRNPIGFKRGHMRTHENTDPKTVIDDRYTVPHTYTKGGQAVTVHYNATMVKSRIGEYQRKVKEAESKAMGKSVLDNRKKWLEYWKEKEAELLQKVGQSS